MFLNLSLLLLELKIPKIIPNNARKSYTFCTKQIQQGGYNN